MIEHQAVHLKEQQERSIAARISSPKCRADFVLRHEAEADEDGQCGRLGCCVCDDPAALRIIRGEMKPKKHSRHTYSTTVTPVVVPQPLTASTHSRHSSSSGSSSSSVGGVIAIIPSQAQKQAPFAAPAVKHGTNTHSSGAAVHTPNSPTNTSTSAVINTSSTTPTTTTTTTSSSSSSPRLLIGSAAAAAAATGALCVCGSTGSILSVSSSTSLTRRLANALTASPADTPPGSPAAHGIGSSTPGVAAAPAAAAAAAAAASTQTVGVGSTAAGEPVQYVLRLQPCLLLQSSAAGLDNSVSSSSSSLPPMAAAGAAGGSDTSIAGVQQQQQLGARRSASAPSGCLPAGKVKKVSWQLASEELPSRTHETIEDAAAGAVTGAVTGTVAAAAATAAAEAEAQQDDGVKTGPQQQQEARRSASAPSGCAPANKGVLLSWISAPVDPASNASMATQDTAAGVAAPAGAVAGAVTSIETAAPAAAAAAAAAAAGAAAAAAGAEGGPEETAQTGHKQQQQQQKARRSASAPSGFPPAGLAQQASWRSAPEGPLTKAHMATFNAAASAAAGGAAGGGAAVAGGAVCLDLLKQEQQQEGGVKLLSGLLTRTTTGPDAEPDELDLGDRESGSSPLSGMGRARTMWRVDEWSAGVVSMMEADGVLAPPPKPAKTRRSWKQIARAASPSTTWERVQIAKTLIGMALVAKLHRCTHHAYGTYY